MFVKAYVRGDIIGDGIAGKAVAFKEALNADYKIYCKKIIDNAKTLAEELLSMDYNLISGGTDTHLVLLDLSNKTISGKRAEVLLEDAGITTNKNMIPFDKKSPMVTSGIRLGTPALTTRGMGKDEMKQIAKLINHVIMNVDSDAVANHVRKEVKELCDDFPLYGGMDIELPQM